MADEQLPGEGPATVISVSMHSGTIAAVRDRAGHRGVSAYIEAAVQRQIERDNLEEIDAERRQLAQLRDEQGGP